MHKPGDLLLLRTFNYRHNTDLTEDDVKSCQLSFVNSYLKTVRTATLGLSWHMLMCGKYLLFLLPPALNPSPALPSPSLPPPTQCSIRQSQPSLIKSLRPPNRLWQHTATTLHHCHANPSLLILFSPMPLTFAPLNWPLPVSSRQRPRHPHPPSPPSLIQSIPRKLLLSQQHGNHPQCLAIPSGFN